jgi:hypothetical protein
MEELFNLKYRDEVDALKESENYEELGDSRYFKHSDREARIYWAFCRPSGSHPHQIADSDPLVSIMAFNQSRLSAYERFSLLHRDVLADEKLRIKIKNRSRMLFRDLVDNDFSELNRVLELVPIYKSVAVDQLKNGRKWNDIDASEIEASKFLQSCEEFVDSQFLEALFAKIKSVRGLSASELKEYLNSLLSKEIDKRILEYISSEVDKWCQESEIHPLQKSLIVKLNSKLKE